MLQLWYFLPAIKTKGTFYFKFPSFFFINKINYNSKFFSSKAENGEAKNHSILEKNKGIMMFFSK